MKLRVLSAILAALGAAAFGGCGHQQEGQTMFDEDTFKTSAGDVAIAFVGHGTLMLTVDGTVVHVDPVSREADYAQMPAADVILVTHGHGDHLDPDAIAAIRTADTVILLPEKCAPQVAGATVMANGDARTVDGIEVEAVPAYNIVHERAAGVPFHPKGEGNGYVVTFGDTRIYIAGDTEDTPEMKALEGIDVAFLPMNLPYTMTPQMVADAAVAFRPAVLYPYHFGSTDPAELVELLAGEDDIEVRVRSLE